MDERLEADPAEFRWPVVVFRDYAISDDDLRRLGSNPWESFSELPAFDALPRGLKAVHAALEPKPKTAKKKPAKKKSKPRRTKKAAPPPKPMSELQQLRKMLAHYDQMMSATKAMGAPDVTDVSDRYHEYAEKWAETLRRIRELEGK